HGAILRAGRNDCLVRGSSRNVNYIADRDRLGFATFYALPTDFAVSFVMGIHYRTAGDDGGGTFGHHDDVVKVVVDLGAAAGGTRHQPDRVGLVVSQHGSAAGGSLRLRHHCYKSCLYVFG